MRGNCRHTPACPNFLRLLCSFTHLSLFTHTNQHPCTSWKASSSSPVNTHASDANAIMDTTMTGRIRFVHARTISNQSPPVQTRLIPYSQRPHYTLQLTPYILHSTYHATHGILHTTNAHITYHAIHHQARLTNIRTSSVLRPPSAQDQPLMTPTHKFVL